MKTSKFIITEEWLRDEYLTKNKSLESIAASIDSSRGNITYYIKKFGIKKTEEALITKDWLHQQYIIENKTQEEIAELAGCTRKNITYFLKKFSIEKSKENIDLSKRKTFQENYGTNHPLKNKEIYEKVKNTMLKKYGVENCSQSQDIRAKVNETNLNKYGHTTPLLNDDIKNKTSETNLERYGAKHHFSNKDVKDKIKQTMLDKYDAEFPIQCSEIKEKIENTNLHKYGTKNVMQNDEIKQKSKDVFLNKYGVENAFEIKEYREKLLKEGKILFLNIHGKTIHKWSKEYNINHTAITQWFLSNQNCTEDEFINYLNNYKPYSSDLENFVEGALGIQKFNKYVLSYKPDFKLSDKIYLNTDGLYWHSDKVKTDNWYHFHLRKEFEDNDLRIFQFRADEIFNKFDIVKSMIENAMHQNSIKIGARKTIVKEVETFIAKEFLNKYHIKGYKTSKHLGLFFQDELISLMSYKTMTNKQGTQILKIERFCSKTHHNIAGGFSKLLKAIPQNLQNLPIHYWVDLRYGTGHFLLNHNFKLEKETLGWEWTDCKKTYNRLKCRANMDDRKLSEKEHAKELGWYRIYDAGQRLYVRN